MYIFFVMQIICIHMHSHSSFIIYKLNAFTMYRTCVFRCIYTLYNTYYYYYIIQTHLPTPYNVVLILIIHIITASVGIGTAATLAYIYICVYTRREHNYIILNANELTCHFDTVRQTETARGLFPSDFTFMRITIMIAYIIITYSYYYTYYKIFRSAKSVKAGFE